MAGEGTNINFQAVRENANIDVAFGFEQLTPLAPTQSTSKSQEFPWPCTKIWIYSNYEIYWTWALTEAATDAIDTVKSMKLPANTLIQMNVAWGKTLEKGKGQTNESSLYFQCRTVSNNTASVRIVRG